MREIIFYCPRFYGYGEKIEVKLNKMGYKVNAIKDSNFRLISFLLTFLPENIAYKIKENYLYSQLRKISIEKCEYFFVIKGEFLSFRHLEYIKKRNPNIRTIMYQWDSVANFDYLKFVSFFDKIYTFDFKDSEKYKFNYLPLFYLDDIAPTSQECDIDLLFVATNTSARMDFLKRLKPFCNEKNLNLCYYLVNPTSSIISDFFKGNIYYNYKDIRILPLSRKKLIELYNRSKVFVDITSPYQTGLSMRIIECYGMNKKLLSSNKYISEDSYLSDILYMPSDCSDERILSLVQAKCPIYKNIDCLSLDNWLKTILS